MRVQLSSIRPSAIFEFGDLGQGAAVSVSCNYQKRPMLGNVEQIVSRQKWSMAKRVIFDPLPCACFKVVQLSLLVVWIIRAEGQKLI